jgi:UDP-3-O-[3-hydroxymyristoyl] N-acetylglucosamine deacetylase/3-hydroxyacyl-[acyl-carrier-protein] dehydratase
MSQDPQQTLGGEAKLDGIGVHSGEAATLRFLPADPNTGIRFRRTDLDGAPEIPADLDHVVATDLGTTLGEGEARAMTVEHVMSALVARGVDNAVVELSGPEAPIRDGSFRDFFEAIGEAGLVEQDEPARIISLSGPVTSSVDGGASYVAAPAPSYRIGITIDFDHPAIGRQFGSFEISPGAYEAELAPARTFGFVAEAEMLKARGLAQGANLENTVVLDEDELLTEDLRFPDEFVRHKAGDIVGDLGLLGARLQGEIVAHRPSHKGNVELGLAIEEHARRAGGAGVVDVTKIMQYLPHRYPFLLVDRIVDYDPKRGRIVGIKNVTINEPFFQGHYPDHPIMPGVLIVEAMAQVGGLLLMESLEDAEDKVVYFMSMDNVKWRRPVVPGDQIVFELEMIQYRRHVCRMQGKGYVDGQLAAEAEFMARIMDR